jgi:hypothetical protein
MSMVSGRKARSILAALIVPNANASEDSVLNVSVPNVSARDNNADE